MLRFLLTPRWLVIHLALVVALVFCAVAGWWQFRIYQDSSTRHDERGSEPVAVDQLVGPGRDIGDAADRPVVAQGRYLLDHALIIPGRIHDGVLGWFVLVPLETTDGFVIPVVRGWVDDADELPEPPSSDVIVTGHLLPPELPGHATVRTGQELQDNELAYVAPDTFADATGLAAADALHGYLLMYDEDPEATDIAVLNIDEVAPIRDVSPWQNLSYTAQWWVFGLAAIAFWVSAVRSAVRSRRASAEQATEISEPARPRVPS